MTSSEISLQCESWTQPEGVIFVLSLFLYVDFVSSLKSMTMANGSESASAKLARVSTDALAEPGPDWLVAKKLWGVAWGMHWIGFGVLFSLLAVQSFIALVFGARGKGFCRKPLFIAINSMLFVLGSTRAVYLFLDPYESRQNGVKDPNWLTLLLFGIAYPCLTSSFCLIHLAFLEVTKLKIGPNKLQNVKFLSSVILLHFAIVLAAETTTSIKPQLKPLLIVCQSFFILWSLILSVSFIYSGFKLMNRVKQVRTQLEAFERNENLRAKKTNDVITSQKWYQLLEQARGYLIISNLSNCALTNFLKHSFKYSGAMLSSNLSHEAKTAQSLSDFKHELASSSSLLPCLLLDCTDSMYYNFYLKSLINYLKYISTLL